MGILGIVPVVMMSDTSEIGFAGDDAVFASRPWQPHPAITGGLSPGDPFFNDTFPKVSKLPWKPIWADKYMRPHMDQDQAITRFRAVYPSGFPYNFNGRTDPHIDVWGRI